jgi:hypothetical protein
MISGFRNVFGQSMVFLHVFDISTMLCIHIYVFEQLSEDFKEYRREGLALAAVT